MTVMPWCGRTRWPPPRRSPAKCSMHPDVLDGELGGLAHGVLDVRRTGADDDGLASVRDRLQVVLAGVALAGVGVGVMNGAVASSDLGQYGCVPGSRRRWWSSRARSGSLGLGSGSGADRRTCRRGRAGAWWRRSASPGLGGPPHSASGRSAELRAKAQPAGDQCHCSHHLRRWRLTCRPGNSGEALHGPELMKLPPWRTPRTRRPG
jgi:hypothetical protein